MSNNERTLLKFMLSEPSRTWSLDELLSGAGWDDQVHVAGSGTALSELGLVSINEEIEAFVSLGEEGVKAHQEGLLEFRIWNCLSSLPLSERTMNRLFEEGFERHEAGPGIGLLKSLGLSINSGRLVVEDEISLSNQISARADFISSLSEGPVAKLKLDDEMVSHFLGRKGLILIDEEISRFWSLTDAGSSIEPSELEHVEMIGEVTPELLQSEEWRGAKFKPFDVNSPAPIPMGGRPHPMQALIERIRQVFLEMGFSEIEGDFVQSAGWNMDALYIPQSHPARTMQDTFYLSEPSQIDIDDHYLDLWSKVHEHGHDTGSKGWGGSFDKDESRRPLLRTHTTVNTVRHIA